jgi:hypothetical protein
MKCYNFLLLLLVFHFVNAQTETKNAYRGIHFTSSHTSFPDSARENGHLYDSVLYDATSHYHDSSVMVIVPNDLKAHDKVDMIFWFHGWRNNIDTAAQFYKLTDQFIASKRNAVLVLAETAKNSPDSYGGKLEQHGMFKELVNDVLLQLKNEKYISSKCKAGNIVLAGHSGAYRVIAYILQNGEIPVNEVFLFDALYSEVDKFSNWIKEDRKHHFVHWFTNHGGGTDEMSDTMMAQLKSEKIAYAKTEETATAPSIIKANKILFVHSTREHNVIIDNPDNFQLLLENSFVLKKIK